MRILLDECIAEIMAQVLSTLGHQVEHIGLTDAAGKDDLVVIGIARTYDAFITLDLHRQEREWLAVHQAIAESNVAIVRLRLPKRFENEVLETMRALTAKAEVWLQALADGAALIIISDHGNQIRIRTRDEVRQVLQRRVDRRQEHP